MATEYMKSNNNSSAIVQLYLEAKCSRKISYDKLHSLELLEIKADHVEKKLIRFLKSQIQSGKILHRSKSN